MKRRDAFRLIPLSLAGVTGMAAKLFSDDLRYNYPGVDAALHGKPGEGIPVPGMEHPVPLAIRYTRKVRDMLTWIRETQSENLLEASYAIARTVMKGGTCWYNWDTGHSTTFDLFPERNGIPNIFTIGYDPRKSKKGDLFLVNIWGESLEEQKNKGVLIIG